jgi:hypothetical protein
MSGFGGVLFAFVSALRGALSWTTCLGFQFLILDECEKVCDWKKSVGSWIDGVSLYFGMAIDGWMDGREVIS